MSKKLKLYELPPSPNNMKVRIALGYKKLDYERLPLQFDDYPGDRTEIVKVSRQPLTPVLAHGDTVIFDSGAILRYLEANFPEAPTIFSGDIDTMRKIEEWEWMARTQIAKSISKPLRLANCIALHEVHTNPFQPQFDGVVFDKFSNRSKIHSASNLVDRNHHSGRSLVINYVFDDRTIDFQEVHGQSFQVAE